MHAALLCLVATLAHGPLPEETAADVAVVCPQAFTAALAPWVEHRQAEGHVLAFIAADQTAEEIRSDIRELAEAGNLEYIVLVGDAEPTGEESQPARAAVSVPTHLAEAEINLAWGSEPELATDNWYADLDDDRIPDVAIGRLPVDTPAELTALVDRILAYEQEADHGMWRRQVNVVAGVGGFGALADGLLETATKRFLTEGIPAGYRTSVTYGSWQSPYCPDPREFRDFTLGRMNEGCLFWVYIGHGLGPYGLDLRPHARRRAAHLPVRRHPAAALCQQGPPIALLLSCYTAAYDCGQTTAWASK